MIGVIPNIVFVILIAIATGYLTFLTTKGGLTDNRFSGLRKKLTNRGWLVLLTLVLISILLGLQEWNSQVKNNQRDLVLEKERIQRDSTITNGIRSGVDSNRQILFNDLSKALARQGLEFDSTQKRIEKLVKDSSNKTTTIINSEDPNFDLCNVTIEKETSDSITFKMNFCSETATSYNITFTMDLISKVGRGEPYFYIWKNQRILQPNSIVNKGKFQSIGMRILKNPSSSVYYFHIKGSYKKFDGKLIPLNSISAFDFLDPAPHFGPPNAIGYEELQQFISKSK